MSAEPNKSLEKHRRKARGVAIIDLILSSMSLCFWMVVMVALVVIHFRVYVARDQSQNIVQDHQIKTDLQVDYQDLPEVDENDSLFKGTVVKRWAELRKSGIFFTCVWLLTVGFLMAELLQITAAVSLLSATEIGKDARKAYGRCRYWRSVCILFTGFFLFDAALSLHGKNFFNMPLVACNLLVRMTLLYLVQHFMNELDSSIRTLPTVRHPNHLISAPVHDGAEKTSYMEYYNLSAETKKSAYEDIMKDPQPYEKA